MYDDILFPYDGSEGANEVLHHAAEMAHRFDATVHLLYVADTSSDSVTVVETSVVDALVQEGADVLDEAVKTLESLGVDHDSEVVQGSPAATIADYADRYGHDLVVMPTRGRTGLSRYLIGSVSEKVVRLSSVPVLTTQMGPDEQLRFPYERLVVATDGSETATQAARHGLSLAAALDATVHLVSVVGEDSFGLDLGSTAVREEAERQATEAVDDLVAEAEDRGVSVVTHVEHGNPVETLLQVVEEQDADAVVMGTTGRRGTDRILLGSVAEKTVRASPVPVLTVRDGEGGRE